MWRRIARRELEDCIFRRDVFLTGSGSKRELKGRKDLCVFSRNLWVI